MGRFTASSSACVRSRSSFAEPLSLGRCRHRFAIRLDRDHLLFRDSLSAWPAVLQCTGRWCFLTLRPGTEPVRSLVEGFLETWQLDRTSTEWPKRRAEWVDDLLSGKLGLRDLLDQTKRRYEELQRPEPPAYFVYVDQGEELYVRSEDSRLKRWWEPRTSSWRRCMEHGCTGTCPSSDQTGHVSWPCIWRRFDCARIK